MQKTRLFQSLISLVLLLCICACGSATAAKAVTDIQLSQTDEGVAYSFVCQDYPYLLLKYKTEDESGSLVLTGQNGRYEGEILLPYRQKARNIKIEIKTPSDRLLEKASCNTGTAGTPAAKKADPGAAAKVRDLTLVPGEKRVDFSFTAPGHHQAIVQFSSVMQKGQMIIDGQEDGAFSGTLPLPCANARDAVTVTVSGINNKKLATAQTRLLFVPPDVSYIAEEGPLKGVKVCIDPGHQALQVHAGKVYQYPGSTKRVSGGDSTMAQGAATLRKESIAVLEISYRICRRLRELGAEVTMTRWEEDVSITNMERAEYANEQGADYFLRIHLNSSSEGTNNAVYVYGPSHSPYAQAVMPIEQYRDVAQTILDALKEATGVKGGIVRMSDQFVGTNWAKMTAFLIECGFLSTPANDWILTTDDYQEKIARGIVDGVQAVVEGRLKRFEFH